MTLKYDYKIFLLYVIPSVLSFTLSGIYAIVDGFFVGNCIGDLGLSAINISYPIVAFIQALGTGVGMGGAIYYAINKAAKKNKEASEFTAVSMWMLMLTSALLTIFIFLRKTQLLQLLGAKGELLALGEEYISIIALGAATQVIGTGLVPFIRNHGSSIYAMLSMIVGFVANIILDYLLVWSVGLGMAGAAWATVIGQGLTMLTALAYLLYQKQFTLKFSSGSFVKTAASVVKIGIAPFGLAMSPNIALIIINRFSMAYGGEQAVAAYACIAYVICIIYLILQGVGDGSQPLISRYYGAKDFAKLINARKLAYCFAIFISLVTCVIMYLTKESLGILFGTSSDVNAEIAKIMPIFLVSVPFVAVIRITTASFYAMKKSMYSYILTFIEPLFMLTLMLILPPIFGGQIMIWWSTVIARILAAILALMLKCCLDKVELSLYLKSNKRL